MGNGTNPDTMVENAHLPYDQHGYDYNKRAAVYPFLAKHLGLDLSSAMHPDGTLNEEGIVIERFEALYTTKRENNKSTQINW